MRESIDGEFIAVNVRSGVASASVTPVGPSLAVAVPQHEQRSLASAPPSHNCHKSAAGRAHDQDAVQQLVSIAVGGEAVEILDGEPRNTDRHAQNVNPRRSACLLDVRNA